MPHPTTSPSASSTGTSLDYINTWDWDMEHDQQENLSFLQQAESEEHEDSLLGTEVTDYDGYSVSLRPIPVSQEADIEESANGVNFTENWFRDDGDLTHLREEMSMATVEEGYGVPGAPYNTLPGDEDSGIATGEISSFIEIDRGPDMLEEAVTDVSGFLSDLSI